MDAIVAGHICLDLIPDLAAFSGERLSALLQPGRLVEAGPLMLSTGGPVANTGLALHRLGIETRLAARVGDDPLGRLVGALVEQRAPGASAGLRLCRGEITSYSIIISAPGIDRTFWHCSGANDRFSAADISYPEVAQARLFHFGYPPVMRRMYQAGGAELAEIFRRAKEVGATTSLDMAFPDPNSESSRVDWEAIMGVTLPSVDIFLPSLEELLFMLHAETYRQMQAAAPGGDLLAQASPPLLHDLSGELLSLGARVVVIKLGARGLYLRTAGRQALDGMGAAQPNDLDAWAERELWAPCFRVHVVGTTGAGDTTIAGFLSALLRGQSPEAAITSAVAVGACCVEAADALNGLLAWDAVQTRIRLGWKQQPLDLASYGWVEKAGLWTPSA